MIVGELDQARAAFAGADALLARFEAASGLLQNEARSLLAKFGLGAEHVDAARRLALAGRAHTRVARAASARGVNCLVLDEPTNHLDLPAIEQLEQALDGFAGTVLLVTHDRALLDAVTLTRRIELVDGRTWFDDRVVRVERDRGGGRDVERVDRRAASGCGPVRRPPRATPARARGPRIRAAARTAPASRPRRAGGRRRRA